MNEKTNVKDSTLFLLSLPKKINKHPSNVDAPAIKDKIIAQILPSIPSPNKKYEIIIKNIIV